MKTSLCALMFTLVVFLSGNSLQGEVAGPIKVSSSGRYFVDSHGKPFLWIGDTAWPLLSKYTRAQAEAYLKNRADKGFTVIQAVTVWGFGDGPEGKFPKANLTGEIPWLDNNPATPNDKYFENIDYLVDFANRQGLVLAILPIWGYFVNDIALINSENARLYGHWLGERYKNAANIIWVLGGDRQAAGFEEVYRSFAMGLKEGDGGAHLITYHPCGGRSSAQYFHDEPWLDFNMIETWGEWSSIYPAVLSDVVRTPVKPVVLAEGAYEDGPEYPLGPITPLLMRRQAWWAFMAGGFCTYGQNQMWRMGKDWDKTFDTPGAMQMAKMKEILTSFNWWELMPNQWVIDAGVSSEKNLNAAMCTPKGDRILIYLSTQCTVHVPLDKISSRESKATWINPKTGERLDAGIYITGNLNGKPFPNGKAEFFRTPDFWEDALLMFEAK